MKINQKFLLIIFGQQMGMNINEMTIETQKAHFIQFKYFKIINL